MEAEQQSHRTNDFDFAAAAEKYLDAVKRAKHLESEIIRLQNALLQAHAECAEATKNLGKFVGRNVSSKAVSLRIGIVVVRHDPHGPRIEHFPHEE